MGKRLSLLFITALLVCAVSTLEFPELIQLVDNTSNDYSTVIFQKNASSAFAAQSPDVIRLVSFALPPPPLVTRLQTSSCESQSSFPDLLHLLCVQRT